MASAKVILGSFHSFSPTFHTPDAKQVERAETATATCSLKQVLTNQLLANDWTTLLLSIALS
jgi:hypothetical protein